ncbi:MAG TPA: FtsX-like permease family protein [Terriglobales bacterium]|nr:FtsX-like permease family protein [Terriglobales bacterium]
MRFEFFIAARYLRAKRRQAVIGIITAISVVGVAAGVASLIIALAINNGFRQDLQTHLLGSMSNVNVIRIEGDGIRDWPPLLERLSKMPHIIAGSPTMYDPVLISRGARARGAELKGIVPKYENKVSDLLKSIKSGSDDALAPDQEKSPAPVAEAHSPDSLEGVQARIAAMPPIILGQDLADGLGVKVGDQVLVTSPQGDLTPFGLVPKYQRFRVVGIFNSGFYDYDAGWAFTSLRASQQLFGLGDIISDLQFKIDDIYQAPQVGEELAKAAGPGYMATNWIEQNRPIFHALKLERVVTFITIGLIVMVAALNILISLIMMVMEKTKDIAVLRSMGARRQQVRNVFIAQGFLIGMIGTVLGLIVGYLASWAGGHYHFLSLSPEVYSIDYVPFAPRAIDGVIVALVSIGVSLIATIYPSISASRVYPAEALRYE